MKFYVKSAADNVEKYRKALERFNLKVEDEFKYDGAKRSHYVIYLASLEELQHVALEIKNIVNPSDDTFPDLILCFERGMQTIKIYDDYIE